MIEVTKKGRLTASEVRFYETLEVSVKGSSKGISLPFCPITRSHGIGKTASVLPNSTEILTGRMAC